MYLFLNFYCQGLLPPDPVFHPAKNPQYPHHTPARDPQVFNAR